MTVKEKFEKWLEIENKEHVSGGNSKSKAMREYKDWDMEKSYIAGDKNGRTRTLEEIQTN